MPTRQDQQPNKTGDWVKWGIGLAWLVLGALIPYVLHVEHRLTSQETNLANHVTTAGKVETEIKARLDGQDAANKQILTALGEVQTGVAKINGYLEGRKKPTE